MKRNLLTILAALSFSGCSLIWPARVLVEIPPRPALEVCADKPDVEGEVRDGSVILALDDAVRLRDWINAYTICARSNEARLSGHIEKLENRLKALN